MAYDIDTQVQTVFYCVLWTYVTLEPVHIHFRYRPGHEGHSYRYINYDIWNTIQLLSLK